MHIFIDESGTFTPTTEPHSLSLVGALVIPGAKLSQIERKYARIRSRLPMQNGEVKGRLMSEAEVGQVVSILQKNEALFEVTAIDMGLHDISSLEEHKAGQADGITRHLTDRHKPSLRQEVWGLRRRLEDMSLQLYVQSTVTFDVIWTVLEHGTMYFSQRRPQELGDFCWTVDGKGRDKVTDWEEWWSCVIRPILQSQSLRQPLGMFVEGDYSHFRRFDREIPTYLRTHSHDSSIETGTDLNMVLTEHFRFSPDVEFGLELVDVLTNATRRALSGRLQRSGWAEIPSLMVHRPHHYVQLIALADSIQERSYYPYMDVLNQFTQGGKNMLAPRFRRP